MKLLRHIHCHSLRRQYCDNIYLFANSMPLSLIHCRQINLESKTECLQFVEFRLFDETANELIDWAALELSSASSPNGLCVRMSLIEINKLNSASVYFFNSLSVWDSLYLFHSPFCSFILIPFALSSPSEVEFGALENWSSNIIKFWYLLDPNSTGN